MGGYEDYDDYGQKSRFNAGVAQTERIDSLQRAIITSKFDLLGMNPDTESYNYEVVIIANELLINEAWAKMSKEERELAERTRKAARNYVTAFPPFKIMNGEIKVNRDNYTKLVELLDFYEKFTKRILDAHDLNNPSREEDDEDSL